MPLVDRSEYTPPRIFRSGHLQTLFPTTCRRVRGVCYRRERLPTPDGDFLDIDWAGPDSSNAVVLVHGLEGCASSNYILGMARAFSAAGWRVAAMNMRGCSGEPNRLLRSYHSGATDDLHTVIGRVADGLPAGGTLGLVGFSLGGNILLKYLGERASEEIDPRLCGAVAFSVPCDLASCAAELARRRNAIYMRRFLQLLRRKMEIKSAMHPKRVTLDGYASIRGFKDFDDRYTAPIHGFKDAAEYWDRCSSKSFISRIRVPTLLVNAADDPFLGEACYPRDEAASSEHVQLEIPRHGGHAGFVELAPDGIYWSERRALEFLKNVSKSFRGGI